MTKLLLLIFSFNILALDIITKEQVFYFDKSEFSNVFPVGVLPKWIFSEENSYWKLNIRDGFKGSFFIVKTDGSYDTYNIESYIKKKELLTKRKVSDFSMVYGKFYHYNEKVTKGITTSKYDSNYDSLSLSLPFDKTRKLSFNSTKDSKNNIEFYLRYYDRDCFLDFFCNFYYGKTNNLGTSHNFSFIEDKRIKGVSSEFKNDELKFFYSYGETDFLNYETFNTFMFEYDNESLKFQQYLDQNNEAESFLGYGNGKWSIGMSSDYMNQFSASSSYGFKSEKWGLKSISAQYARDGDFLETKGLTVVLGDGFEVDSESNSISNGFSLSLSDSNFFEDKNSRYNLGWLSSYQKHKVTTSLSENFLNDIKTSQSKGVNYTYNISQLWKTGVAVRDNFYFLSESKILNSNYFIEGENKNIGLRQKYYLGVRHLDSFNEINRYDLSSHFSYAINDNFTISNLNKYIKNIISDSESYSFNLGGSIGLDEFFYEGSIGSDFSPSYDSMDISIALNFKYIPSFNYKNIKEVISNKDIDVCVYLDKNFNLNKDKEEECSVSLNRPVMKHYVNGDMYRIEKISNERSSSIFLEQSFKKGDIFLEPLDSFLLKKDATVAFVPVQRFYYKKIYINNINKMQHDAIPLKLECDVGYTNFFSYYGESVIDIKVPKESKDCFLGFNYNNFEGDFLLEISTTDILKNTSVSYNVFSALDLVFKDKSNKAVVFDGFIEGIGEVKTNSLGLFRKKYSTEVKLKPFYGVVKSKDKKIQCRFKSLNYTVLKKASKKIKKLICF